MRMWSMSSALGRASIMLAILGLCLGAPVARAAGASQGSWVEVPGAKRLSASELKRLFSKDWRLRELPISDTGPAERLEFFRSNGDYQGCADRAVIQGSFTIRGDRLCTPAGRAMRCRVMWRKRDQRYFQSFVETNGRLSSPKEVEITMNSRNANCFHQGL